MSLPIDTTSEQAQVLKEKIKQRRSQMLVHSALYYEMDESVVDDATWQRWADELRDLQNDNPLLCTIEFYDEAFARWDGSTGHHLTSQRRVGFEPSELIIKCKNKKDMVPLYEKRKNPTTI